MIKKITQLCITNPSQFSGQNLIKNYEPIYKLEIYAPPKTAFALRDNEELMTFVNFDENKKLTNFIIDIQNRPIKELFLRNYNSSNMEIYKSEPIIINLIYGERSNE